MKSKNESTPPKAEPKIVAILTWKLAKDIVKGFRVRSRLRAGKHAY